MHQPPRVLRCVCREWLLTTNQTLTRLAPCEMRLDWVVANFPYLTSLDLSACSQVRLAPKARAV